MNRYVCLLTAVALLSGCSKDEKVVDLSGIVFSLYVFLVFLKYLSPSIISLSFFRRFGDWARARSNVITFFLYMLSALLVLPGVLLSGLDKILIFIAMVVAIIAMHVKTLSHPDELRKRQAIDIVLLGCINFVVLSMLWFYGGDLIHL